MGKQFIIKEPYSRVAMPDGESYDAGDTVVLSDANYARLSPGVMRTFDEEAVTDVADPPEEEEDSGELDLSSDPAAGGTEETPMGSLRVRRVGTTVWVFFNGTPDLLVNLGIPVGYRPIQNYDAPAQAFTGTEFKVAFVGRAGFYIPDGTVADTAVDIISGVAEFTTTDAWPGSVS